MFPAPLLAFSRAPAGWSPGQGKNDAILACHTCCRKAVACCEKRSTVDPTWRGTTICWTGNGALQSRDQSKEKTWRLKDVRETKVRIFTTG